MPSYSRQKRLLGNRGPRRWPDCYTKSITLVNRTAGCIAWAYINISRWQLDDSAFSLAFAAAFQGLWDARAKKARLAVGKRARGRDERSTGMCRCYGSSTAGRSRWRAGSVGDRKRSPTRRSLYTRKGLRARIDERGSRRRKLARRSRRAEHRRCRPQPGRPVECRRRSPRNTGSRRPAPRPAAMTWWIRDRTHRDPVPGDDSCTCRRRPFTPAGPREGGVKVDLDKVAAAIRSSTRQSVKVPATPTPTDRPQQGTSHMEFEAPPRVRSYLSPGHRSGGIISRASADQAKDARERQESGVEIGWLLARGAGGTRTLFAGNPKFPTPNPNKLQGRKRDKNQTEAAVGLYSFPFEVFGFGWDLGFPRSGS